MLILLKLSCSCTSKFVMTQTDVNGWFDTPTKICGKCFSEVNYSFSLRQVEFRDRENGSKEKTNEENKG